MTEAAVPRSVPPARLAARRPPPVAPIVLIGAAAALVIFRDQLGAPFADGEAREWMTVFIAVSVQALPFLVLGVVLSSGLTALVSPTALARLLPRRGPASVVTAGLAGMALPGCECGAVPIAGRLIRNGVPGAAALTFLLAAPAINPIVLVATATAFPGQPELVLARFSASLATAVVMGLIWLRIGTPDAFDHLARRIAAHDPARAAWDRFTESAAHDLLHAGGWLVVGAAAAATLQVLVPTRWVDALAGHGALAVVALGLLAVLLAVCSEADAFVATSFTAFSPTARLTFMVVGPAIDIKLAALQYGTFGRRFTQVFAPLTFVVAVLAASLAGAVLL